MKTVQELVINKLIEMGYYKDQKECKYYGATLHEHGYELQYFRYTLNNISIKHYITGFVIVETKGNKHEVHGCKFEMTVDDVVTITDRIRLF